MLSFCFRSPPFPFALFSTFNLQSMLLKRFCLEFYSSNWGPESKTQVSYWWSWISLFAHVFSVKTSTVSPTIHSPTIIHSPTWKLNQNKCTRKCSKKGNTPRKWWFKSSQLIKRIYVLTSFCLACDPQRKNVSLACRSIWKRRNSRQPGVQAGSSSRTFNPEATGAGSKVQSKKLYRLKTQTLTFTLEILLSFVVH